MLRVIDTQVPRRAIKYMLVRHPGSNVLDPHLVKDRGKQEEKGQIIVGGGGRAFRGTEMPMRILLDGWRSRTWTALTNKANTHLRLQARTLLQDPTRVPLSLAVLPMSIERSASDRHS